MHLNISLETYSIYQQCENKIHFSFSLATYSILHELKCEGKPILVCH